jgi:hypothetical protein
VSSGEGEDFTGYDKSVQVLGPFPQVIADAVPVAASAASTSHRRLYLQEQNVSQDGWRGAGEGELSEGDSEMEFLDMNLTKGFCSMLFTVSSTGQILQKTVLYSRFKIPYKKSANKKT